MSNLIDLIVVIQKIFCDEQKQSQVSAFGAVHGNFI